MIDPFGFILCCLATWRLSHMLTSESGPGGLLSTIRYYAGAYPYACNEQKQTREITNVLCCIYCTSVWVSPLIILIWYYLPIVVYALAVSAGALVVKRAVT